MNRGVFWDATPFGPSYAKPTTLYELRQAKGYGRAGKQMGVAKKSIGEAGCTASKNNKQKETAVEVWRRYFIK